MEKTIDATKKYKVKKDKGFQRMEGSEIAFRLFAYLFVGVFALLCVYPLVYSFSSSISTRIAVQNGNVVLFPIGVQWDAFNVVIHTKYFWIAYANTFFVTLYGTVYCMILSILGAYALSKKRIFGHKFFNFILIFTMWFTAGTIPMYLNYIETRNILSNMGIWDQKWLIVLAMGMSAFNVILLRNAFDSVPKEIEEAAVVDGADDFQIMSKIYVPMSKATVATVALFFGISRWNGYFWAMKTVDNPYDFPLQVVIQNEIAQIESDLASGGSNYLGTYAPQSIAYAMIVCAIIPILIIYPFIQKYFATGVNLGGVKE
jgi:putative aldouronate transport system permease protein